MREWQGKNEKETKNYLAKFLQIEIQSLWSYTFICIREHFYVTKAFSVASKFLFSFVEEIEWKQNKKQHFHEYAYPFIYF